MSCQHLCVQASFVATGNRTDISLEDPDFWQKWAKKAELDLDAINGRVLHTGTQGRCLLCQALHTFFLSFLFCFLSCFCTFLDLIALNCGEYSSVRAQAYSRWGEIFISNVWNLPASLLWHVLQVEAKRCVSPAK